MPSHFDELTRSPHFDAVVAANRLYLGATVDGGQAGHWALCCLPSTGGRHRLTAVAMAGQEVFTIFKPGRDETLTAKVAVSHRTLSAHRFDTRGLELIRSTYAAAGDDQVQVYGDWASLGAALAEPPLREAARVLAERLLPERTTYARFHDDRLAALVHG